MAWDNRDVLPAHGARARAVPGGSEANRNKSGLPDVEFPPNRPDARGYGSGVVPGSFPRYEARTATLAASTAFQEVARFSGRPDRVDLHSSAIGVEFRLRNRGQDQSANLVVRAAGPYETDASFELVEARDPAGAGGQLVTVVGYWKAESTVD
jgi:hypothetical protein